ncbi:MAG: hypothetical protein GWM98_15645 [Nitrospinaceae bacterium]|nr:hypothetical protein [Nitrospinaceae bacterium]NIR55644.1 hypothetical protein [Nitrospinaceae bacterium]NIS86086.1 hypothetical protein [Nitrospinaceae bacterium]NIT82930.1 hypothetical protein [Nitrospinaceae bacterium]NIU45133.1 hypothetical protein [Nitrospinaceae bacterium]
MEINLGWIAFGTAAFLVGLLAFLTVKGYGVLQVRWLNVSRLREIRQRAASTEESPERRSLQLILEQCESLRARWVLNEGDLSLIENTRRLVEQIAQAHHPQSSQPLAEARIEKILNAFLEMKNHILQLTQLRGIEQWTRFRLRHVVRLSRAWEKKKQWDRSDTVQAARRMKFYPIVKWAYTLTRSMDLVFWSFKMTVFFLYDIVFKIFLIRWYLLAGEVALRTYSDRGGNGEPVPEQWLEDMDTLSAQNEFEEAGLSPNVQGLVADSRKTLQFHLGTVSWPDARKQYTQLVGEIARVHHPEADQPVYEVRLYDLLLGFSRFAEQVVNLNRKPVFNKILQLRLSHFLKIREATHWALENQIADLARKYKVGTAVKYSALFYKAFKKGNPGILFKDVALMLTREGVKRWLLVYLHDKIAVEADWVYRPK